MTVKELIEILQNHNPDMEVLVEDHLDYCPIDSLEEVEMEYGTSLAINF